MAAIWRLAALARTTTGLRSFGRCVTASCCHGSAAVQTVCDLEDEWLDENAQWKESEPVMDLEGSVSGRGVQWVVIGEPGAKKHVYASWLSKLLRVPHISVGSLVRQELSPRSSLYGQARQISNALNEGQLVPEDVIFGLLSNRLVDGQNCGESGFILDGLPRNALQAAILHDIADLVISFKCTDKLLDNSLISSTSTLRPRNEKLWQYSFQVKELEDYYKKQRKLLSFPVAGAAAEAWQELIAALCLKHMNAAFSLPKLTG